MNVIKALDTNQAREHDEIFIPIIGLCTSSNFQKSGKREM